MWLGIFITFFCARRSNSSTYVSISSNRHNVCSPLPSRSLPQLSSTVNGYFGSFDFFRRDGNRKISSAHFAELMHLCLLLKSSCTCVILPTRSFKDKARLNSFQLPECCSPSARCRHFAIYLNKGRAEDGLQKEFLLKVQQHAALLLCRRAAVGGGAFTHDIRRICGILTPYPSHCHTHTTDQYCRRVLANSSPPCADVVCECSPRG